MVSGPSLRERERERTRWQHKVLPGLKDGYTFNFTGNTMNAIQNNTQLFILKLAVKAFFSFFLAKG